MKTNNLDDIFRKKLVAYEVQPSDRAMEIMMKKLRLRNKFLWIKRWLVAAGLLLFGVGTIWMADYLIKAEGDKIVEVGAEKIISQPVNKEILLSEMQIKERNAVLQSDEKDIVLLPAITNNTLSTDDMETEAEVKVFKRSNEQIDMKDYAQRQNGKSQKPVIIYDPVVASRVLPEVKSSASDMQTDVVEQDEIVPIKIVYRRSNDIQDIEPIKKNGLFRKGYKKIAAVVDRMNIKDGAKDKLRKTRDDLVAMNPVRLFKKEEN